MPDNDRWNEAEKPSPDLGGQAASEAFGPRAGRRVRIVGEPLFSLGDLVAGIVILVMVCGPLALGALGI